MFKKIFIISLILGFAGTPIFAKEKTDIGNKINDKEYPSAENVLPAQTEKTDNPVTITGLL